MPDLLTHMAVGLVIGSVASRPQYTPALVVGSCLPDLLGRVPAYAMSSIEVVGITLPEALMFGTSFLHLPVGLMIVTALLSMLAVRKSVGLVWMLLMTGSVGHLILDSLQQHWGEGYMWGFPMSDWEWEAGLIGTESTVLFAPFFVLMAYVIWRGRHSGQPWSGTCDSANGR